MEKIADINAFNSTFVDMVEGGASQVKEASVSLQSFTRDKLRENCFTEKVITPQNVSNEDLDKSEDPELMVKWTDREPDSPGAYSVPYGIIPSSTQFKGTRYGNYFGRVVTEEHSKDIDNLRGYTYDIRGVLMEQDAKNMATQIDSNFITTVNSYLGAQNTVNPLNLLGLPQNVQLAGGITRENVVESFKYIKRLLVPFGPGQTDGGETKGVMLMSNLTYDDFLKLGPSEVGWDTGQDTWIKGLQQETVLGVKTVTTIKTNIIPEGSVYLFSDENYLGKFLKLYDTQVYMETKAYLLKWFSYLNLSISVGNVKGACLINFNG